MATIANLKLSLSRAKRTGVIDEGVVVSFLAELKSGIPALLKVSAAEADVLSKVIDMKVLFQLSGRYIKDNTVVELDTGSAGSAFTLIRLMSGNATPRISSRICASPFCSCSRPT